MSCESQTPVFLPPDSDFFHMRLRVFKDRRYLIDVARGAARFPLNQSHNGQMSLRGQASYQFL